MCVPSVNMNNFALFRKIAKLLISQNGKKKPSSHHFFPLAVIVNNRLEYAT